MSCPFCRKKYKQMKSVRETPERIVEWECVCGAKGKSAGRTPVNKRGGKPEDYNPDRSLT